MLQGMIQIDDATNEEQSYIGHQLVSYNNAKAPFTQDPPLLSIDRCVRENNEVVGGICARVYGWNILYIDTLWVKEEYRNKGYASALVKDVEAKAKAMKCKISHLDTYDFQAKDFYERLGYTVFGTLEDCPEGHNRYFMSKRLG